MNKAHRICYRAVVTAPSLLTSDPSNLQKANSDLLSTSKSSASPWWEILKYIPGGHCEQIKDNKTTTDLLRNIDQEAFSIRARVESELGLNLLHGTLHVPPQAHLSASLLMKALANRRGEGKHFGLLLRDFGASHNC